MRKQDLDRKLSRSIQMLTKLFRTRETVEVLFPERAAASYMVGVFFWHIQSRKSWNESNFSLACREGKRQYGEKSDA
jgi:hypothetical protein